LGNSDGSRRIVSAVFTAVAAVAAWRAASAARETSRESRQALAAALRPNVRAQFDARRITLVDGTFRLVLVVQNISEWDAKDVDVQVEYRDGEKVSESTEHLGSRIRDVDEEMRIPLRFEAGEEQKARAELARVTVLWSDSQRLARYKLQQEFNGGTHEQAEQISAP
jgi:hypothetical protein